MTFRRVPVIVGMVMLAACSGGGYEVDSASAADAYFAGLPEPTVDELLAMPYGRETLAMTEPKASAEMLAQAMVMNIEFCRDLHRIYDGWTRTGQADEIGPLPVPDDPREPSYSYWEDEVATWQGFIDSGDASLFRDRLLTEGACTHWVPAVPGDVAGPTIADAIRGSA